MESDHLDEISDDNSSMKSKRDLTRALEVIWDPFFGHLGPFQIAGQLGCAQIILIRAAIIPGLG